MFTFEDLPYDFSALEPHIDARTMELHYTKHHRGYYDKFIGAVQGTDLASKNIIDIFGQVSKHSALIRNNGGGYFNHTMFWNVMSPKGGGEPTGDLMSAITGAFGSFDAFKTAFSDAAASRFGSGWAWLLVNNDKKLIISSTPNQDNPYMDVAEVRGIPVMGLDVWEHAYYLKYQNRRPEYISAFWNVVNWKEVGENFIKALNGK
jgi:Fe-Mn family superoxide dismutase